MTTLILLALAAVLVLTQRFVYRRWWDKNLTLSVTLGGRALFEGETLTMTQTLANTKRLPLPLVEVALFSRTFIPLGMRTDRGTHLYSLPGMHRVSAATRFVCAKRGYYRLDGFLVSGCDLMVTGWQTKFFAAAETVTVYPRPIDAETVQIPYRRLAGELLARRFLLDDPFAFRGIRAYQPGDRLKDINFKATARTGEWMTNLYDGTVTQQVVLVLNLQDHMALSDPVLQEGAIRLAAFLARYFIGEGVPVALLTNGKDTVTGREPACEPGTSQAHLYHVYESLARIDLSTKPQPLSALLAGHQPDQERVYLLISRYDGPDLAAWFETARPYGAIWAVPYRAGDNKIRVLFDEGIAGYVVAEPEEA